ncbi:MAG: hypothetical protein EPN91_00335 [Salinibacterium sp.]|nr:MAG: hypothetical protein EPN91_00335 [Salinibacterium sp.]
MTTATALKPNFDALDPSTVEIDPNIRTDAEIDGEFLNSIAQYGVIVPVLGRRATDGKIYIRAGQRRTLAAQKLQLPLPVFWFDGEDDTPEPAWLATVLQIVENDHREPLTTGQRIAAYRQLELDGLSVTKIAQALVKPKEQVKAALTISKSERATEIAAEYDIDMLQLAAMVEFEDDEHITAQLLEIAVYEPEQFDHALSRARQEKTRHDTIRARRGELEASGKTTVNGSALTGGAQRLSMLEKDESITIDPEVGDGVVIHVNATYNGELIETEWVLDPASHGYKSKYGYSTGGGAQNGPMTDEQKAERRRVVACNKAWDAAAPVRADWLTNFMARKSFPKDAASFIAIALTRFAYEVNKESDNLTHQLLSIEQSYGGYHANALAALVEANPAKAGLVTLALVLGKLEAGTSRNTWRNPEPASRFLLLQLRAWGYTLSPVELIALGEATDLPESHATADDVDLDALGEDEANPSGE